MALYTAAAATVLTIVATLWLVSVAIRDASIIDVFWGPLFVNQLFDCARGRTNVRFAGQRRAHVDVIPRTHLRAVVDRDGAYRRMRKNETDRQGRGQFEFGDDRLEIVTIGTESMQPDDGRRWIRSGFEFDALECHEVLRGSRGVSRNFCRV